MFGFRGRFLIGAYSCKRGSALGLSKTFVCRGTNGDAPRRAGRGRYPGCGFASEGYPQTFYLLKFVKPNDASIDIYDYKEVSGGIYRPFKIVLNSPMELTITFREYFFNKMIDTDLLSKPGDK